MTYAVFKAKFKDFDKFKEVFESVTPKRHEAGITEKYILRGIDDPNQVVLVLEVKQLERAKAYYDSPFLRDATKRAGIIGEPEILFLNEEYEELKKVSGL